jgi:integrase
MGNTSARIFADSPRSVHRRVWGEHVRHTLGTRLREAGADDRTIADILGQKSVSMARRYSENAALPEEAKILVTGLNLTGRRNKT